MILVCHRLDHLFGEYWGFGYCSFWASAVPHVDVILARDLLHQKPRPAHLILVFHDPFGCLGSLEVAEQGHGLAGVVLLYLLRGGHDPISTFGSLEFGARVRQIDLAAGEMFRRGHSRQSHLGVDVAQLAFGLDAHQQILHFLKFVLGQALLAEHCRLLLDYLRLGAVAHLAH